MTKAESKRSAHSPASRACPTAPVEIALPAGDYAVTVHLLAWEQELGAVDEQGHATPDALPDFVVVIAPASGGPYRTEVVTFDEV